MMRPRGRYVPLERALYERIGSAGAAARSERACRP